MAIVGIGCRFPGGADGPAAFWNLLRGKADALTEIPRDRWNPDSFYHPDPGRAGKYCARRGGFLKAIELFDPSFFGISPREAARMDPQQRLLLEVSWEALEDAGHRVDRGNPARAGVFIGISSVDYSSVLSLYEEFGAIDSHTATGTSYSIAANRVSHAFDFTGPSVAVDSACSSSLVAVHLACSSLQNGECNFALAGGVHVMLNPRVYVAFSRLGMISPTSSCKAFDAGADGFARAEGAGVVVLKPLQAALDSGDFIYAIVEGTGVNQDGRTPGITVPNGEAQESLFREVCRRAQIHPPDVTFAEAHGTGTAVGDPIEARALSRVFCEGRSEEDPLFLGSVKTNLGHLEPAAGIAGMIKAALAIHHRAIPANLHFHEPNPDIDFRGLRLRVPLETTAWPDRRPLLAAVNSFGFGGTNAHALLSAPPRTETPAASGDDGIPQLFAISAHDGPSLTKFASACGRYAGGEEWAAYSLRDLCHTAATRRARHPHRLAIVAGSKEDLQERLQLFCRAEMAEGIASGRAPAEKTGRIAFVFSGQGPQWWGMGRELLAAEPVFRRMIETCDRILSPLSGWSLLAEMTAPESGSRMGMPAIAQPAIFALQMALSSLWESWGIRPDATVGHSVGEVAAACIGGMLTLEDALRVIYHRGRCMQQVPATGRMLALGVGETEANAYIDSFHGRATVGAYNSPDSVTISGDADALEQIEERARAAGIFSRFLTVDYAFHSHHMDGIREDLLQSLKDVTPLPSNLAVYSTVSGRRAAGSDFSGEYWWHNVRRPVHFSQAVSGLIREGVGIFLELGPHPVLSGPVTECALREGSRASVLHSLKKRQGERACMLGALGGLHVLGKEPNWHELCGGRVAGFPKYEWNHERHWHQSGRMSEFLLGPTTDPLLGTRLETPLPSWVAHLNEVTHPFLLDHCVKGDVLLPATAFVELGFAAAVASGTAMPVLEDIRLHSPAFLSSETDCLVQTSYNPEDYTFSIHSRADRHGSSWQLNATGKALPIHAVPTSIPDIRRLAENSVPLIASQDYYGELRKFGFEYGPSFQGVSRLFACGDHEFLGEIDLPECVQHDLARFHFHPAALDACLQVMGRAAPLSESCTYLPVAFKKIRIFGRPQIRMWSQVQRVRRVGASTFGCIRVVGEDGSAIAEIEDFEARTIQDRDAANPTRTESLFHSYSWVPQAEVILRDDRHRGVPAACSDGAVLPPGGTPEFAAVQDPAATRSKLPDADSWLIFGDSGGTGEKLAHRLEKRGVRAVLLAGGTAVVPGNLAEYCGIVYLRSLDASTEGSLAEEDADRTIPDTCFGIVQLVQDLIANEQDTCPRLWIVTRRAGLVPHGSRPVSIAQAPVWGLGRVIANEYPRARCTLVDLGSVTAEQEEKELDSLVESLLRDDREDELAFRSEARYVRRLQTTTLEASWPEIAGSCGDAAFRLECEPPGILENLRVRQMQRAAPGENEIEIEVEAAGLNFRDVMLSLNMIPGKAGEEPPLGFECAGVVTRTGSGCRRFEAGDRVVAFASRCIASHVTVSAACVAPVPAGMDFAAAATIPVAFLTAYFGLVQEAKIKEGETVLIHSAAGGVGMAAIQVAKNAGAQIIATAGTEEKREFLRRLGIRYVLDSRSLAFADQVMQLTGGEGVDIVLNSLSGEAIPRGLSILRDHGRFVELGVRDLLQNRQIGFLPFRNNLSVYHVDFQRVMEQGPAVIENLLDAIIRLFETGAYAPLPYRTFPFSSAREAFRHMSQAKHIGKIVLQPETATIKVAPPAGARCSFRADGSYLITGGLGGFGLLVAQWMVERGARHLVLMSRREVIDGEIRKALSRMERLGAEVAVRQGDVSRPEDLLCVLGEFGTQLPPLLGVMHAAMVLDDCLIPNLTPERLKKVLDPKLKGAYLLDRYTRNQPLEFFVLFSSCSSILGLPGQANYNCANAFLDALSWERQRQGLPATAVNWGFLGRVGYAASHSRISEYFDSIGITPFSPEAALEGLGQILRRNPAQIGMLGIDWPVFLERVPSCGRSAKFASFRPALDASAGTSAGGPVKSSNLRHLLQGLEPSKALEFLESALVDQIARVLGSVASKVDVGAPLTDLGFDSLMAVELRNWVETSMGVALRTMEIMKGPSVRQLSETLLAALHIPIGNDSSASRTGTSRAEA